jgi:multiple sugar transport system permease protein
MKKFIIYVLLAGFGIFFLYPFIWLAAGSFKPETEIAGFSLWSHDWTLQNYRDVVREIPLGRALLNSLLVSSTVTISVVILGSITGFALSRLHFKGRDLIFGVILLTMVIPFQITLIPMYVLMVKLGWVDNYLGLIVPAMISPMSILLFRQFFLDIPQDLLDAARIDGCSELRILFQILYPVSWPVVITVGLLTFMASWNDVLWPLIVIRTRELMTMPQMVALFAISGETELLGPKLAASLLLALPIVVAYAFFQKYFIESMATSGLKS